MKKGLLGFFIFTGVLVAMSVVAEDGTAPTSQLLQERRDIREGFRATTQIERGEMSQSIQGIRSTAQDAMMEKRSMMRSAETKEARQQILKDMQQIREQRYSDVMKLRESFKNDLEERRAEMKAKLEAAGATVELQ